MIWWWMPFMAFVEPVEARARKENSEVAAQQKDKSGQPGANSRRQVRRATRKVARPYRKPATKTTRGKGATRNSAARKAVNRKSAGKKVATKKSAARKK